MKKPTPMELNNRPQSRVPSLMPRRTPAQCAEPLLAFFGHEPIDQLDQAVGPARRFHLKAVSAVHDESRGAIHAELLDGLLVDPHLAVDAERLRGSHEFRCRDPRALLIKA